MGILQSLPIDISIHAQNNSVYNQDDASKLDPPNYSNKVLSPLLQGRETTKHHPD
jgi:hypothetical protein